jgi:hypothetical protein
VPDPLLTALQPGAPASGAFVAGQLARSLSPAEDPAPAPPWLLGSQVSSFRRALAAIRRFNGALLADPVGSGKTFVALAIAANINRGATACLVPASLLPQWQTTALRLSIRVALCSHEQVSRGRLPQGTRGLVVIDEAHHFRNPHTRRYRHLAPWLVGRSALLLTATPIVNRVADLAHQLLLTIRDDALALDGVPSIRALLRRNCSAPALGQVVLENDAVTESRPRRVCRRSQPSRLECSTAVRTLAAVDRLRLSQCRIIAELIRGVLLRASASSPAAFRESLRRYRRLLLHAADALSSGQPVDRRELRRFTGELDDQLVWWELLPVTRGKPEIELDDREPVEAMIQELAACERGPDPKLNRLRVLLDDGLPSLVFTGYRTTVSYLRNRLGDHRIAWCTGEKAGIGAAQLPRQCVLGWFRVPTASRHAPSHLVVTDVAAEGLDLQRVARVVHYDLPWTPMRLEQREGRAVRLGSQHSCVEVVQFSLPGGLERRLRVAATLTRKHRLPALAGIGISGRHVWRWRTDVADRYSVAAGAPTVATIAGATNGLLAGFALIQEGNRHPMSATIVWIDQAGNCTEAPEIIEERLQSAASQKDVVIADGGALAAYLSTLAVVVRQRLASARGRRWIVPHPGSGTRRALTRLQSMVSEAVRRRDAERLADLERAIGFVAGGYTAGEALLVERLAQGTESELRSCIGTLPPGPAEPGQLEVKLTGLVLFGPAKSGPDPIASPPCPAFKPHCSTSTAP